MFQITTIRLHTCIIDIHPHKADTTETRYNTVTFFQNTQTNSPYLASRVSYGLYIVSSNIHLLSTLTHYDDVIMTAMASQITSLTIVYSIVYSAADKRKHQSSVSLCAGNSPGTGEFPTQMASYAEMFSFDDVIMHRCHRMRYDICILTV